MLNPDYMLLKMLKFIADQKFVNENQLEFHFNISKINNTVAIRKRISKLFKDGLVRKSAGFNFKRRADYTISAKGVAVLKTMGIDCGEYLGIFTEASYKHIVTITDLRIHLENLLDLENWKNREDILAKGEYFQAWDDMVCPSAFFNHKELNEKWGVEYSHRYESHTVTLFQRYSQVIPRHLQHVVFIFDEEITARRANIDFEKNFTYPATFISHEEIVQGRLPETSLAQRELRAVL